MSTEAPLTTKSLLIGLVTVANLTLSALALLNGSTKTDRDDSRLLEQRLCRLEAHSKVGDCGN